MELYQQGCLDLPDEVIKIWADNGFGKMVSRRQGNSNPRVKALPPQGDTGAHGLYYHASFYDLQAASHITMLPNSTEFVCEELTNALRHGVDDYWLINCSNVKPHAYLLDYIAQLWQNGTADPEGHCIAYALTTAKPMPCPWQNALPDMRTMPYRTGNTRTTMQVINFTTMCPGCLLPSSSVTAPSPART